MTDACVLHLQENDQPHSSLFHLKYGTRVSYSIEKPFFYTFIFHKYYCCFMLLISLMVVLWGAFQSFQFCFWLFHCVQFGIDCDHKGRFTSKLLWIISFPCLLQLALSCNAAGIRRVLCFVLQFHFPLSSSPVSLAVVSMEIVHDDQPNHVNLSYLLETKSNPSPSHISIPLKEHAKSILPVRDNDENN